MHEVQPPHHDHDHAEPPSVTSARGIGDNQPERRSAQWQQPHRPSAIGQTGAVAEPDFDLVEASFVEGFVLASDPTSFLRLAGVPFAASGTDGRQVKLLRVQIDQITDVGSVTPTLGGTSFRYDPLPARLASRRRRLRFVYHNGSTLDELTFAEARALVPASPET